MMKTITLIVVSLLLGACAAAPVIDPTQTPHVVVVTQPAQVLVVTATPTKTPLPTHTPYFVEVPYATEATFAPEPECLWTNESNYAGKYPQGPVQLMGRIVAFHSNSTFTLFVTCEKSGGGNVGGFVGSALLVRSTSHEGPLSLLSNGDYVLVYGKFYPEHTDENPRGYLQTSKDEVYVP